jgi:hypothetical protein
MLSPNHKHTTCSFFVDLINPNMQRDSTKHEGQIDSAIDELVIQFYTHNIMLRL